MKDGCTDRVGKAGARKIIFGSITCAFSKDGAAENNGKEKMLGRKCDHVRRISVCVLGVEVRVCVLGVVN